MNQNGNGYAQFLERKAQLGTLSGFEPIWMPPFLFDFQKAIVEWDLRKGRGATFADCGLGKTPMQLVWAENVIRKENKPVLIITPLAVGAQTVGEGEKFGIECHRSNDGSVKPNITITNYERLHYFNPNDFVGVVCDESSILKNFDGATRAAVTEFMRKMPYRLLCTATASPNDFTELGNSSEALGELGHMDMLNRFFKNDNNTSDVKGRFRGFAAPREWTRQHWRFKGHAEIHFWRWVASWARAIRRPSDMGFANDRFVLPALAEREHVISSRTRRADMLFDMPAIGLHEQRHERRRTIKERCEKVASLVADTGEQALLWCHLNPEGDLLEEIIKDAVQVSGADSDDVKEERLTAFARGQVRVLVTKPKIGCFGLNLQSCAHVTFFPSHSYEQYYQGVRRCWRFGQARPVVVDVIASEGERDVLKNLQRKADQADQMFSQLVSCMNQAEAIARDTSYNLNVKAPKW